MVSRQCPLDGEERHVEDDIELKMPDLLVRCLEDNFEDVFVDELMQQRDRLPLQDFTNEAG